MQFLEKALQTFLAVWRWLCTDQGRFWLHAGNSCSKVTVDGKADLNALLLPRQNTGRIHKGDLFQQLIGASCCLKLCQEAIAIL